MAVLPVIHTEKASASGSRPSSGGTCPERRWHGSGLYTARVARIGLLGLQRMHITVALCSVLWALLLCSLEVNLGMHGDDVIVHCLRGSRAHRWHACRYYDRIYE